MMESSEDETSPEMSNTGSQSELDEVSDANDLNLSTEEESASDCSQELSNDDEKEGTSSATISLENAELHQSNSQMSSSGSLQNSLTDNSDDSNAESLVQSSTERRVSGQEVKATVKSNGKSVKQMVNSQSSQMSPRGPSTHGHAKSPLREVSVTFGRTTGIANQRPEDSKNFQSINMAPEASKSSNNSKKVENIKISLVNKKNDRPKQSTRNVNHKSTKSHGNILRRKFNNPLQNIGQNVTHSGSYHKTRQHQGIILPLPEVTETYPGGRLDFAVPIPKPHRPVLHSTKYIKTNMISKSDDHLIVDNTTSSRNAKSTGNLKHRPTERTRQKQSPRVNLSEGVVTINERAKGFRKENRKIRADTQLAAFNASSDTKLARPRHHEPTRRKSFMRALHKRDKQKRGTGKGFMTTVGKIVPRDHSIVLIGQAKMKDGKSVKTVVLGTLQIDDGNVGSGDSILTVSQNQKDLISGKRGLSKVSRHQRNISATKDKNSPLPQRPTNLFTAKVGKLMALKGFNRNVTNTNTGVSDLKTPQQQKLPAKITGKPVQLHQHNYPPKMKPSQEHNQREGKRTFVMPQPKDLVVGKLSRPNVPRPIKEKKEKAWVINEDVTKTVVGVQDAAFVQYEDPLLSNSDEDVDENMLERRTGQVFTIGKSNRPRQISKAGKVFSKNILWQIPKGNDTYIKSGEALQRKMKGIRLEIRRTTDVTSKSWMKEKPTRAREIVKKGPKYAFITEDLPLIDSDQMLDIRNALIGLSYQSEDLYHENGRNEKQLLYLRAEANHYDYIPSTRSVQSSIFHQALNGFVYIGARIRKVLRKKATQEYSIKDPSYDEIVPAVDDPQEGAPDILDVTNQYSSDEFDSSSENSEESKTSSDPDHQYDTPSSSNDEISESNTSSDHQSNTTIQSQSDTHDSINGSSQSSEQDISTESTAQSTLMPSSGMKPQHSKMTNGICIEKLPKIVIGRRRHGTIFNSAPKKSNKTPQLSSPRVNKKSVRMSPSCDSIYMQYPSSRKIVHGNHWPVKRKRQLGRKKLSKKEYHPHRSQSFHTSLSNGTNENTIQSSRNMSYGSCGDSVYNSVMNKSKAAILKQSKMQGNNDQKKTAASKNMPRQQIEMPNISARHSSENSDKSHSEASSSSEESNINQSFTEVTDLDSASYLLESSSHCNSDCSNSLSSTNTYSVTASSSKVGSDSRLASGETETSSDTSDCLSVIQEETLTAKQPEQLRRIETISHFIQNTACSNHDHPSNIPSAATNQNFVGKDNSSAALKTVNKMTVDPVSINPEYGRQNNLLHPSCNSKTAKMPDRLVKRCGEEYSNESSYEHTESDNKHDSWDISVNSTNGIPSPVVADDRMKDFSDENIECVQYNSVDECSAVATAGLAKRRPKGSRPIQKIRALLNYLRGDDLFLSNFLARNTQSGDEKTRFSSEECCMMSKISPFDLTSILTGVSPKCGCIKRFEPFFEKLYEQNAYQPLAKRIVDFSFYEGLQIHNQLHPLYTEGDVDMLCDKLVYEGITKGIAEFSVIQSISSTLLEIRSEDLLDNMTVEDVKEVVEEMVANVITGEAMQQGKRAIIVESFIRESVPNVSARQTNRATLSSMYREAMKCAIIEETRGSNQLKCTKPCKTSPDTPNICNTSLSEQVCCDVPSKCSIKSSSKILSSMASKSKGGSPSSDESKIESPRTSNVSLRTASLSSKSDDKMPHPSSRSNLEWEPSVFDKFPSDADTVDVRKSVHTACIGQNTAMSFIDEETRGNSSEFLQRSKSQNDKFLSLCQKFDYNSRSKSQSEMRSKVESESSIESIIMSSYRETDSTDSSINESSMATSDQSDTIHNVESSRSCHTGNQTTSNSDLGNGKWISKILDSEEELFDDEDSDSFSPHPSSRLNSPHGQSVPRNTGPSRFAQTSSATTSKIVKVMLEEGHVKEQVVAQDESESYSTMDINEGGSGQASISRQNDAAISESEPVFVEDFSEIAAQGKGNRAEVSDTQNAHCAITKCMTIPVESFVRTSHAPESAKLEPGNVSRLITKLDKSQRNLDRDSKYNPQFIKQSSADLAKGGENLQFPRSEISQKISQKRITEGPKSKVSNFAECSWTRKKCHHPKTFLSCVQCRQALFKSTKRLRQQSHRSERHNCHRQLCESNCKLMKTSQQSGKVLESKVPFPSGGQMLSHQRHTLNQNVHTFDEKPVFQSKWLSDVSNTESTSCSEYQYTSSNRDLSSESSLYGLKGGPVIIGRGNVQSNQPYKPNNQLEKMTLQIGLAKSECCDQTQIQSLYDNTPAYFLSCDQRIVIGEENTSKKDSAGIKDNTTSAVHPCGCNKPSEQSPRSDPELDDEKIVEKVRRMFRPRSPTLYTDDVTSEIVSGVDSSIEEQSKNSTLTDKADASVQTSARDMTTDSDVKRSYDHRSRHWNISSSLDSDSDVESFLLIKNTKKTGPLHSARSKSEASMRRKRYSQESSLASIPPKSLDGEIKKSSVMDLFDELRNELNNLGTIIDTSNIAKNRDAGILSKTFKPEKQMKKETSHPTEKVFNGPNLEITPKIGTHPGENHHPKSNLDLDIDEETMNTSETSSAVLFPYSSKLQDAKSTRYQTESNARKPSYRNFILNAFKNTPHVSAHPSPRGHKRLPRHDSYGGSSPKRPLRNRENKIQRQTSKTGINVVAAAVRWRKKPTPTSNKRPSRDGQQQRFFAHRVQIGNERQSAGPGKQKTLKPSADSLMSNMLPVSDTNMSANNNQNGQVVDHPDLQTFAGAHHGQDITPSQNPSHNRPAIIPMESTIIPEQAVDTAAGVAEYMDDADTVNESIYEASQNSDVDEHESPETANEEDNSIVPKETQPRRQSLEVGRRSITSNEGVDTTKRPSQAAGLLNNTAPTPVIHADQNAMPDMTRQPLFTNPGMGATAGGAQNSNTANQHSNQSNNMQQHAAANITINLGGNSMPETKEARRRSQEERRQSVIPKQAMKAITNGAEEAKHSPRNNSVTRQPSRAINMLENPAVEPLSNDIRRASKAAEFRRQSAESRRHSILSNHGMDRRKRSSEVGHTPVENIASSSTIPDAEIRRQSTESRRQSGFSKKAMDEKKRLSQVSGVLDHSIIDNPSNVDASIDSETNMRRQSVPSKQSIEERRRSSNLSRMSVTEDRRRSSDGTPAPETRKHSADLRRQSILSNQSIKNARRLSLVENTDDHESVPTMSNIKRNSFPQSSNVRRQSVIPEEMDSIASDDEYSEGVQDVRSPTKRHSLFVDTIDQATSVHPDDFVKRKRSMGTTTKSLEKMQADLETRFATKYSSEGILLRDPTIEETHNVLDTTRNFNAKDRNKVKIAPRHAWAQMKEAKTRRSTFPIIKNRVLEAHNRRYSEAIRVPVSTLSETNQSSTTEPTSSVNSSPIASSDSARLHNTTSYPEVKRNYGLLDSCVNGTFPSEVSIRNVPVQDPGQILIKGKDMFPAVKSYIELPSTKSKIRKNRRKHKRHAISERCCKERGASSEELTDHGQYLQKKKWQRRVMLQRKISKSCLSSRKESSFMSILRHLFYSNDIHTSGFETLIRIGAVLIIVIYAMHEEIFDYDGDFPT